MAFQQLNQYRYEYSAHFPKVQIMFSFYVVFLILKYLQKEYETVSTLYIFLPLYIQTMISH